MKTRLTALAVLTACFSVSAAHAQTAPRSAPATHDEWTYRQKQQRTNEEPRELHPSFSIAFDAKPNKLVLASANKKRGQTTVWNVKGTIEKNVCILDIVANEALGIANSCSIALTPGMTWNADDIDTAQHVKRQYRVIGQESVQTPAGKFNAIRIESDKQVAEVTNPRTAPMALGETKRYRTVYWYSSEVKGMVRVEREIFGPTGARESNTVEELESVKLAK